MVTLFKLLITILFSAGLCAADKAGSVLSRQALTIRDECVKGFNYRAVDSCMHKAIGSNSHSEILFLEQICDLATESDQLYRRFNGGTTLLIIPNSNWQTERFYTKKNCFSIGLSFLANAKPGTDTSSKEFEAALIDTVCDRADIFPGDGDKYDSWAVVCLKAATPQLVGRHPELASEWAKPSTQKDLNSFIIRMYELKNPQGQFGKTSGDGGSN